MRKLRSVIIWMVVVWTAGGAWAQVDFSRFYAVGDSLTAGFSHGSLNELFQRYSYPALIAEQAGVMDFEQPLVSDPGIPPRLVLLQLFPRVVLQRKSGLGQPINLTLPRPYNNLAVPGATLFDLMNTTTGGLHDLILRGLGTQFQQLVASQPTFAIVWIGNNDVLPAVLLAAVIPGVTVTPLPTFSQLFQNLLTAFQALLPNTQFLFLNLPDATRIPFATTIPPCVPGPTGECALDPQTGQPVPLIGSRGPIPLDSQITLAAADFLAQGYGIPVEWGGNGQPLPDDILRFGVDVVLYPEEIQQIREVIQVFNGIIRERVEAAGYTLFDIAALFDLIAERSYTLGGVELTAVFLTGGLFSYDGVHPSPLGYAVLAHEIIRFMNQQMGADLPLIDLGPFLRGEKGANPIETMQVRGQSFYPWEAYEQMLQWIAPKAWQYLQQVDSDEP